MKKIDEADLFLLCALIVAMLTICAIFSFTKNFAKPYNNVKVEIVK